MIYQELWDLDQQHNGCVVATRDGGRWDPEEADVYLDQQVQASGRRHIDLATRPLFHDIREGVLERDTYRRFISLLDNYIVHYQQRETETPEEREEIDGFLDAVAATEVMQRALGYIRRELNVRLGEGDELRAQLYRIWFEPYTNFFNGRSTHYCSGFEHVFVGEGKFNIRHGGAESLGEISGYHSWIKFFLDEAHERVNFLGYKYDARGQQGPRNPNVITLQMAWYHKDMQGAVRAELFKKIGGFFVGTSPECEIAFGTVAYFESLAGLFRGDRRRVSINGATYDLVLYLNVTQEGRRGNRIRSFYPEFISNDVLVEPEPPIDRPEVRPAPAVAPLRITSALVNPRGREEGREWVEIANTTEREISLVSYELRDARGRRQPLDGSVGPGATLRVPIRRDTPDAMQLTNSRGSILLYRESSLVSSATYKAPREGEVTKF